MASLEDKHKFLEISQHLKKPKRNIDVNCFDPLFKKTSQ